MKLTRLFTAGNVDDGKSTLIGRLLIDSGAVSTDIIQGLTKANELGEQKTEIDLAFLTDGLRSERELGITIDVAYKYFSTHIIDGILRWLCRKFKIRFIYRHTRN